MIGKTISHFKILEKIGAGGMGVVYKAQDTKLDRLVALKFLPQYFSENDVEKQRFIHEAKAASALDHQNICNIYEIDESEDGQLFIAMAYYDGESLKDRIERGPLAIDDVLDIGKQIAQGLSIAHKHQIIHRDIKPANILTTNQGVVKIVDFGLAKALGQTPLTKSSTTLGTVAYMSPEQGLGEGVDHRTDIWSLGVVLYEMLTGQVPFKGDYDQAVTYSILNEDPEPITRLRTGVPMELERIVNKGLEKDPAVRYQHAEEFIADLLRLKKESETKEILSQRIESTSESQTAHAAVKSASPKSKAGLYVGLAAVIITIAAVASYYTNQDYAIDSIAVLPFDNISPDPNDEYLADGMTDELISKLSKVRNFRVIARTSVMRYKETLKNIAEIGGELGVGALVAGSVRKVANDLRISVQLVDVETQTPIWSKEYDRQLEDVFDIQDEVSRSIVAALELTLSPQERERLTERPIENIHAYESYIRARQAILDFDVDAMQRALRDVKSALGVVGDNELLYSTQGWLYAHSVETGIETEEDYYRKAEELADKIFDLYPNSFYGYALLGKIHNGRGNTQEAVNNLKHANSIQANNPDVLLLLGYNYAKSGNSSVAKPLLDKLVEIDPLTPLSHNVRGFLDCVEGRFETCLEYYSKAYDMDPESPGNRFFYIYCLALNKRVDEASSIVDLLAEDSPQTVLADLGLILKHALRGEKRQAIHSLTPRLKAAAGKVEYLSRLLANCLALIDEKEKAINWLENAVNLGFIHYPYLSEYNWYLESIRGEERFKKLLEKVKYRWENFEI